MAVTAKAQSKLNNPTQASESGPPGGGTVSFRYDPFGRRIQKAMAGTITNYAYGGANIIAELNATGGVVASYTQGAGIDEPLARRRGGYISYYHADGLGSVTSLTNTNAQPVATYVYDSFGNTTAMEGIFNPFRYTGREQDPETGLYYYRARYYDPAIGRFISEDPIGFAGSGTNSYAYVSNDPTNFVDPEGLCKSKKQDCIDNFLKNNYGNFVGGKVVPDFSLISIGTNLWGYAKSSALTLGAKGALIYAPKALSWVAQQTATNLANYPGQALAAETAAETSAFWATTAVTAEWVVLPAAVGATAFSTTADAYARWECRNVQ